MRQWRTYSDDRSEAESQEIMCRAMEKMRDEAASEAAHETQVKMALNMLKDGVDIQTIVKYSELSVEEVESLIQKRTA